MNDGVWQPLLLVGLGGFVGANTRYWLTLSMPRFVPSSISAEVGTCLVNLIGSVMLAFLLAWSNRHLRVPPVLLLFGATGFFGSFTTFSTFANQGADLARTGNLAGAAVYILGTNTLSILGVFVGLWLGNRL